MSQSEYWAFDTAHPDLRIERPAAPARLGYECGEIAGQLNVWARLGGRGITFDSSAGFDLPNGANRAPDAAWVLQSRLVHEELAECVENGAQLGFLIDPIANPEFPGFNLDLDRIWNPHHPPIPPRAGMMLPQS